MESTTALIVPNKLRLKSMQIFSIAAVVLLSLFITVICVGVLMRYEVGTDVFHIDSASYWKDELPKEQEIWFEKGITELEYALNMNLQKQSARNVIMLLWSGISPAALAAVRYESGQRAGATLMSWDMFPHVGRLKNSCSNTNVCDAMTVATALFGGVKTNFKVGGYDAAVAFRNCTAAANGLHRVESVFEQAQKVGLRTGLVTTQRLTGPIAAALYAHTPDTAWECDANMPQSDATTGCKDVAQQLLDANINVLLGGGRQTLVTNVPATRWDAIDETVCNSRDGRNLMRDWQTQKLLRRQRFAVLQGTQELRKLNGSRVDYALGVFANGDLKYGTPTAANAVQPPTLSDMFTKALEILQRREKGYMLLLESGLDPGSEIRQQVKELLSLDALIRGQAKLNSTSTHDDTLILLAFPRGNYAKGSLDVSTETELIWNLFDVTVDDLLLDERFKSTLTDTVIYAKGPQSHLFHGIHEEVYMAHMISYALDMGWYRRKHK